MSGTLLPAAALQRFARHVFEACGSPRSEAGTVADHLVTANLMGYDTHGVIRIPQYVADVRSGVIRPGAPLRVEKDSGTTAVLNCGWNFGQVGGLRAMELAVEKAGRAHTAAVVATQSNHAGRLGAYTQYAAERGLIALAFCNSPIHGHFVLPWGGREGRLATNPVSYAIPCDSGPPVLADFSTAESSEGGIRLHRNLGKDLPPGTILDAGGHPTTDPGKFYGPPMGAILPFGGRKGYRGYALSLLVEILGGILGGSSMVEDQPGNGLAFFVLDPHAFLSAGVFESLINEAREYVKSAAPAPGFEEVLLPGEPDFRTREQRLRTGIPIDDETWSQVREAAASVRVEWDENAQASEDSSARRTYGSQRFS